jgi:hypothetical protein
MYKITVSFFFLLSSLLSAMEYTDDNEVKEIRNEIKKTMGSMNMDLSRVCMQDIINADKLDFDSVSWLILPGALIHDVVKVFGAVASMPVMSGKLAVAKINQALDDFMCKYTVEEQLQLALAGYKSRLNQIKPFIKNKELSAEQMNILVLACTVWDSQTQAPEYLLLAGNKFLKRKFVDEKYINLYNNISNISMYMNAREYFKNISYEEYMSQIMNIMMDADNNYNAELKEVVLRLKDAALSLENHLSKLSS